MNADYSGAKVALICGGSLDELPAPGVFDLLVTADSGLDYALEAGLVPDLAIGDFDSAKTVPTATLLAGVETITLPPEKDDTDTLAALRILLERGAKEVVLYCAFGGRFDHQLAILQAATWAASQGLRVSMLGKDTKIQILDGKHFPAAPFPPLPGFSFSVLALSKQATGVSISGAKYELNGATLSNQFPIGISNEWVLDQATANAPEISVSVADGQLAVIMSKLDS